MALPLMLMAAGSSNEFAPSSLPAVPTSEQYAAPSAPLRAEFARSRRQLDYSWHKRYSTERQQLQDGIIRELIASAEDARKTHRGIASKWGANRGNRLLGQPFAKERAAKSTELSNGGSGGSGDGSRDAAAPLAHEALPPEQPWAIFTAGCMGAGKTRVMGVLAQHGLLPLERFVRVDQDLIRSQLPETRLFMRLDRRTVGQLTQQESGSIAEIATEEVCCLRALQMHTRVHTLGLLSKPPAFAALRWSHCPRERIRAAPSCLCTHRRYGAAIISGWTLRCAVTSGGRLSCSASERRTRATASPSSTCSPRGSASGSERPSAAARRDARFLQSC